MQRSLLNKCENYKIEQYQRRDDIRIFGLEDGQRENEEDLEVKVVNLAYEMGVDLKPEDTVYR